MNDHELDQLLRRAQPESATRVPQVAPMLRSAGQELLEAVMSAPEKALATEEVPAIEVTAAGPRRRVPRQARWLLGVAATVAVVLAVAVPMWILQGRPQSAAPAGKERLISADGLPQDPLIGVEAPYLVLEDPDFTRNLLRTDDVSAEQRFVGPSLSDSNDSGHLNWKKLAGDWRRAKHGEPVTVKGRVYEPVKVFGVDGELMYDPHDPYGYQLMFQHGEFRVEFYVAAANRDYFYELVRALRSLSDQEWHDTMPQSYVAAEQTDYATAYLMFDASWPKDFGPWNLVGVDRSVDFPFIGERATTILGCAWVTEYARAYRDQDLKGLKSAARAMGDWQKWQVWEKAQVSPQWRQIFGATVERMAERESVTKANAFDGRCRKPLG